MLPNFSIGLNETQLGIVAPTWFQATMRNTLSRREAELALTLGTLFSTDEALKVEESNYNLKRFIFIAICFCD